MQVQLRQRKPEVELAELYRRRETVSSLIRSLEHYDRTRVRPIQRCTPRVSRAAA